MNKNDSAVQPGARYGTGTIAPHPSLHLPPQADGDGGSGKALLPPIDDAATMSLLEANGANNVNDGIDWGETSSVSEDCERVPLNSEAWESDHCVPISGTHHRTFIYLI